MLLLSGLSGELRFGEGQIPVAGHSNPTANTTPLQVEPLAARRKDTAQAILGVIRNGESKASEHCQQLSNWVFLHLALPLGCA